MLLGADGKLLTNIKFCQAHLAAQKLGIRLIDDIEFNDLVNTNTEAAEQMRNYAVWTSLLKDVKSAKNGGYTAKHIARPEFSRKGDIYVAGGAEKAIKLPKDGFFKISELLESETGLPEKTYGRSALYEPCAYWMTNEGLERPVGRGDWDWGGHRGFGADAHWGPSGSDTLVGARGASDEEPSRIKLATAEALSRLDEIGRRYGVETSDIACALTKKVKLSDIVL